MYCLDVHTHTVASGHAYSTLLENLKVAHDKGLKILGTTDHASNMPGSAHELYFLNYSKLPRKVFDVLLLHGCEANIIDFEGSLDLSQRLQKSMDILIASIHAPTIETGSEEINTNTYINVMKNPNVDILGHIGNPYFPVNYEEIVLEAKKRNVIIEINNSSFVNSRKGSKVRCIEVARLCKKHKLMIIVNSDAHFATDVGSFDVAIKCLEEIEFPNEYIFNTQPKEFLKYLKQKGKIKDIDIDLF